MSEEQTINNDDTIDASDEPMPTEAKCNICGKVAKSAMGLKIHMNSHAPKKTRTRIGMRGHRKRAAPIRTEPPVQAHEILTLSTEEPKATQPWRPASILTAQKNPGMRPRWVRKDLLEKRIEEGWQPRLSDTKSRVESPEKTIVDGVPLGRYVTKRNLVL
jgi:hypothetical protein